MVQKRSVETELYDFGVGLAPWPNSTLLVGARTLRKGSGTGTFVDSVGSITLISLVGDNPPSNLGKPRTREPIVENYKKCG